MLTAVLTTYTTILTQPATYNPQFTIMTTWHGWGPGHLLCLLAESDRDRINSLNSTAKLCSCDGFYCWWTKSCTTKDDGYPIIHEVLTIPGGAGFLPSTVVKEDIYAILTLVIHIFNIQLSVENPWIKYQIRRLDGRMPHDAPWDPMPNIRPFVFSKEHIRKHLGLHLDE